MISPAGRLLFKRSPELVAFIGIATFSDMHDPEEPLGRELETPFDPVTQSFGDLVALTLR